MVDRIQRIVCGDVTRVRPVILRLWAILALLVLLTFVAASSARAIAFGNLAMAGENDDAPLPRLSCQELAAKIRQAMKPYDGKGSIRVVFSATTDTNWNPAEKQNLITYRGRARYETDGSRWRAEYDSMMPTSLPDRLLIDRWSSGFDGVEQYDHQISKNQVILAETNPGARQWTPRSLICEGGDELVKLLEEPDQEKFPIAIDQRAVDGSRCYVAKTAQRPSVASSCRRSGSSTRRIILPGWR
jgi:hypothetical protein